MTGFEISESSRARFREAVDTFAALTASMGGLSMSAVPSVVFTGPDKALLDRSARAAETAAKALNWEAIVLPKFRKKTKLEYDRLMRDAHDLRCLGLRLAGLSKRITKGMLELREPVALAADDDRRGHGVDRRIGGTGIAPSCDERRIGDRRRS